MLVGFFDPDSKYCHFETVASNLKWTSSSTSKRISQRLLSFSCENCWKHYHILSPNNVQHLLRQLEDVDLRYIRLVSFHLPLLDFLNHLHTPVGSAVLGFSYIRAPYQLQYRTLRAPLYELNHLVM